MGKIALLVPREEMVYQAHNLLQEAGYQDRAFEITCVKVVRTKNVVVEARQAIAGGASIIIARGLHASLIKQYTDIPVIEIVITAQEMALLVVKAKQILKKEHPVIAVVGFRNMFCDMSYFEGIYEIELRTFFASDNEHLRFAALQAVEEKVDLIIGGELAVETAAAAGIASLFLSTTEDSLRNAFSMAKSISFAMDVEKKKAAQMETLLDYSFSGVANIDAAGRIVAVNPLLEDMLRLSGKKLSGKMLTEVFPDLEEGQVEQILEKGKNSYAAFLRVHAVSVYAVLAPVLVEGKVEGAILTCHKMAPKLSVEQESQNKRHSNGLIALGQFSDILQESEVMQKCIRQARLYALSDLPVLIEGEAGTEKRLMAQSIHNVSLRNRNAFADVSVKGLTDGEQFLLLFGEKGAAVQADGGTLLLEDGDLLSLSNQYRLLQLIRYRIWYGKELQQNRHLDVRVMITASAPGALERAVKQGMFREDLYYLLKGLDVKIPPMRLRKEDLKRKLETSLRENCDRYGRYHGLTKGAMEELLGYSWPGNLYQIEHFCERLILTASKRSLDEWAVKDVFGQLFGKKENSEEWAARESRLGRDGRTEWESRPGRDGRAEWESRPERDGRTEWESRLGRDGRTEWESRPERDGRTEWESRPERDGRAEREGRLDREGRAIWESRIDREGRPEKENRIDREGRAERENRSDEPGRFGRPEVWVGEEGGPAPGRTYAGEYPWPDERSRQIAAALKKYGGNRKKTAEELGISKATLWRQMKKYGLDRD